ncbi:MAG: hypothetical protein ACRC0X_05710 [Brevinema sp.]
MNLYKLLRYCCFLFLVTLSILYFFPRDIIPYFSAFYQNIEEIYHKIPSMFIEEEIEPVEFIVQQQKELLLIDPKNTIYNFFSDLSVDYALEAAINRNFDDLEYLIETYLRDNRFFEDIVLYWNGTVIYKYNQVVSPQPIVFIEQRATRQGEMTLEFTFNTDLLQRQLNQLSQTIYLSYRSRIFSQEDAPSSRDWIDQYKNQPDGILPLDRRSFVYKSTINAGLKTPLILFFMYRENFGIGLIVQFLFLLLFPLCWVLLALIDRIIVRKLSLLRQKKEYKDFLYRTNQNTDKEDNLEWLDDFIGDVETSKKEMEEKK